MAFTDAEILGRKNQILGDMGEPPDGSGFLEQLVSPGIKNIDKLWTDWAARGGSNLDLATLFVKRECWNKLIGATWRGQYIPVGVQHKDLSNMVKFLQSERDTVQEQIDNTPLIGRLNIDWAEPDDSEF
jgi:hypothetical protein